ncbi:MAG: phosphoketolase family protein [Firmicutes bacterium]|nr:phosphoketolase family protein [Alicyclobacillaceae bacterium]MCL6498251.1 phosphoketolase family protein [Bacillota bacterium]
MAYLPAEEYQAVDRWWRTANYLSLGMLYLQDNPLLREPLAASHIKPRLLGHWGSVPGQNFIWAHLNRAIRRWDLNILYISGPGHGAPAVLANAYLEGTYSEWYPECGFDEAGLRRLFCRFSSPGGVGSHCGPETPGSIHEGGELGYSLAHAFGAAFDHPDLVVAVVVGDGEAETGPLAAAWHSNKFLNPARDGTVLPFLHLNGYKLANPTVLARIPEEELAHLLMGYGWAPRFVSGDDPQRLHHLMAEALDEAVTEIRRIWAAARDGGAVVRPRWPVIVLRTPKGWTAPKTVDGHLLEGTWRAHQVPLDDVATNEAHRALLEAWLRAYEPEQAFDEAGALRQAIRATAPQGARRMSANPYANGGQLRKPLALPDFRAYAVPVAAPGTEWASSTALAGQFLRDVVRQNPKTFRVFGPDETASNRLQALFEATDKTWVAEHEPADDDGGHLGPWGRVMEVLSEHTLEGWLEGYVLTGRHGLLNSYEAFVHIVDSMVNQHAKWIEKARAVPWRAPISSLNILISSTVWRQDHNGFTHQDPGFLDVITNKQADVVRIYLPPDANTLLSVLDHCLRSANYVNVIVADKQPHLQYLPMEEAVLHCAKGVGIWDFASNDEDGEPDAVIASAGDVPTMEALAAVALLRRAVPALRLRFVNIVDLMALPSPSQHPHGISDAEFVSLFTPDRPVIFNFHGYPALIHKLIYRRPNHAQFHVHGYREMGSINTPLQLAIENHIDRFSLAIDVLDRVPGQAARWGRVREKLRHEQLRHLERARKTGTDDPEVAAWTWPGF